MQTDRRRFRRVGVMPNRRGWVVVALIVTAWIVACLNFVNGAAQ